jgi:hypothetical protein
MDGRKQQSRVPIEIDEEEEGKGRREAVGTGIQTNLENENPLC